jgi:predicted dehydrogenase
MQRVRIGIVGLGNMGGAHAAQILAGKIPRLELAAVCDVDPKKLARFEKEHPALARFGDSGAMIRSGKIDAILVAAPHYFHTTIGIDALKNGLHLMVEKPISVHKADAQRLIAAHKNRKQVFAAMFNQRTDAFYIKIRNLIQSGELGEIRRINWIITNWFRPEAYYASGSWRATWAGEGGGVLLNQCPHNLDLFQWMFGMPKRVRAFCSLGRYHDIEVEDDVTAYMEYANGTTALFVTSTGEAPGTNRLEITAERGRLVYEDDRIALTRNEVPMGEFSRTTDQSFAKPDTWEVRIPARDHGGQHNEILRNFTGAILDGTPLIAPAAEGINSVELAGAMLFSSFRKQTVDLPLSAPAYEAHLKKLIAGSRGKKKKAVREAVVDLSKSF